MLLDMPNNTQDLFTELQKRVVKLPQDDRNAFVIDLMKFLTDWQFAYLTYISNSTADKTEEPRRGSEWH